ncbi:uncharacterized protein ARMOST_17351 [Armillaria ostoyae]|uniref:Uncharacterized protein n=1 Tax=Armillaria ostoyae TaxID=47428 RepID=A0A284RYQ6_ARMOS|nr:uncharacterized protein ARMOST_17351 [Armillaria ostoyae]
MSASIDWADTGEYEDGIAEWTGPLNLTASGASNACGASSFHRDAGTCPKDRLLEIACTAPCHHYSLGTPHLKKSSGYGQGSVLRVAASQNSHLVVQKRSIGIKRDYIQSPPSLKARTHPFPRQHHWRNLTTDHRRGAKGREIEPLFDISRTDTEPDTANGHTLAEHRSSLFRSTAYVDSFHRRWMAQNDIGMARPKLEARGKSTIRRLEARATSGFLSGAWLSECEVGITSEPWDGELVSPSRRLHLRDSF